MAKMTNCCFCGKEIPASEAGWSGEQSISLDIVFKPIPCCTECKKIYDIIAERDNERFKIKCENFKAATKTKLKDGEIVAALKAYKAGRDRYLAPYDGDCDEAYNYITTSNQIGCFRCSDDGYFRVAEATMGETLLIGLEKGLDLAQIIAVGMPAFTKDDISMLEYRLVSKIPGSVDRGKIYSFEVRLNDEKVISYKPCIAHFGIVVPELITSMVKDAEREAAEIMEKFKETIGSDIPVSYVKKFKDSTVPAASPEREVSAPLVKPVVKKTPTNDVSVEDVQEDKITAEKEQPTEYSPMQNGAEVEEKPLSEAKIKWMKIRSIACFTTLFTTLGCIVGYGLNETTLGGLCFLIGYLSTIIACPKKLLATCGKVIGGCVAFGLTILVVGVIPLAIIGLIASLCLIFVAPAIVTIPYYFKELKLKIKYHR